MELLKPGEANALLLLAGLVCDEYEGIPAVADDEGTDEAEAVENKLVDKLGAGAVAAWAGVAHGLLSPERLLLAARPTPKDDAAEVTLEAREGGWTAACCDVL